MSGDDVPEAIDQLAPAGSSDAETILAISQSRGVAVARRVVLRCIVQATNAADRAAFQALLPLLTSGLADDGDTMSDNPETTEPKIGPAPGASSRSWENSMRDRCARRGWRLRAFGGGDYRILDRATQQPLTPVSTVPELEAWLRTHDPLQPGARRRRRSTVPSEEQPGQPDLPIPVVPTEASGGEATDEPTATADATVPSSGNGSAGPIAKPPITAADLLAGPTGRNTDRPRHRLGNPDWKPGVSGNPLGRPRENKTKAHDLMRRMVEVGEEAALDLLRTVISMAVDDKDPTAAKLLLDRLWPVRRGQPLRLALGKDGSAYAGDVLGAMDRVMEALGTGELTSTEAAEVSSVINVYRQLAALGEIETRLTRLEQASGHQDTRHQAAAPGSTAASS